MNFTSFFGRIAGHEPYPFQERLATGPWPDLIDIPTGLGKTAAVTLAWLYKRLWMDTATPRRLVWCLPMRVLVEQTSTRVQEWITASESLFMERELSVPRVHVLMGGGETQDWTERPEDPAVLIGTQDMLLSRALMRGYGMSRYRWPVDYALLHNDALWVFDEVQLMGAGLPTSAQLEAFRRDPRFPTARPARTLWVSATLRKEWVDTVDFRPHLEGAVVMELSDAEKASDPVRRRREAPKVLRRCPVRLAGSRKNDVSRYVDALADHVVGIHAGDAPTLVILNSVERAQNLATALTQRIGDDAGQKLLLVHARFRQAEREALNRALLALSPHDDRIIVATQAVEAGVDITSRRLVTELAPWAALVQRFGRCNRGADYLDAAVEWIDLAIADDADLPRPYESAPLAVARAILEDLTSAAPADLPPVLEARPVSPILRRKDFLDLFSTEPDLAGFDVDVSPFIRDTDSPPVLVFWRDFEGTPPATTARPERAELCPVSLTQIKQHLEKQRASAFQRDTVRRRWERVPAERVRPGQTLMLRVAEGGYSPTLGFVPRHLDRNNSIKVVLPRADLDEAEHFGADPESQTEEFQTLDSHLAAVERYAAKLCDAVDELEGRDAVVTAARWHDIGKAHPAFQAALLAHAANREEMSSTVWAKSDRRGRLVYRVGGEDRPYFRHELPSMLAWLAHGDGGTDRDLIAYLIAAHHGKVRMSLRALPGETVQGGGGFTRGVHQDDVLPSVLLNGRTIAVTPLKLDIMRLGEGDAGLSWTARVRALLDEHGPFRLAWLEALVRVADWRGSTAGDEQ